MSRITTDWGDDILKAWEGQAGDLRVTPMAAPRSPHGDPLRDVSGLGFKGCGVHRVAVRTDDPLQSDFDFWNRS